MTNVMPNSVLSSSPAAVAMRPLDKVNQEVLGSEVMQRCLPDFLALSPGDLLAINVDVPALVATVLGLVPRIRPYREEIAALMASYDLVLFDKLEDYALALNDAHGSHLTTLKPSDDLDAALEEATELRAVLLADATALVHRGLLNADALGALQGPIGFKNIATDLHLLSKALGAVLPQAAGKSGVTQEELNRATRLHQHIYRLVGEREQSESAVNAAAELRRRAFTCLLHCYDHVQHGIHALRWPHGDANDIAPSLYSGRNTPRKKGREVESAQSSNDAAAVGTATVPAAGSAARGAGPDASAGARPGLGTLGATPAPGAGTPGADPFMS